jgi:hypothetical protein
VEEGAGIKLPAFCKPNRWLQCRIRKMILRTTFILTLFFASLTTFGQGIDSVSVDLKRLTDLDFFSKYSFYDNSINQQDIKITKLIWSLDQVRKTNSSLRQKGISTVTRIDERPTEANRYYVVGHYQLPTSDHLTRMSFYRVDTLQKTIDYQNLDDFAKDRWKRIK